MYHISLLFNEFKYYMSGLLYSLPILFILIEYAFLMPLTSKTDRNPSIFTPPHELTGLEA